MFLAGRSDGRILALRQRVVLAHQALQLGEFADHFGQQIRLRELRRALGLLDIGADQRRDLGRQLLDARDALGLRAELLVKHDLLEFRQPRLRASSSGPSRRRTSRRDSRARITRSLPAMIALPPSVASMLAVRMNLLVELAGLGIADHKAFLVVADGGADHLVRDRQELLVERAHQHDRPFDQARDFVEQRLVLDQLKALREGQLLGIGQDDVLAALRDRARPSPPPASPRNRRSGARWIAPGAMKRWP